MSSKANKSYKFTIINDEVAAIYEVKNGYQKQKSIDNNEHWTVNGSNVVKTEYEHGLIKTSVYTDADGDGVYLLSSKRDAGSDGITNKQGTHNELLRDGSDDNHYGANDDDIFAVMGNSSALTAQHSGHALPSEYDVHHDSIGSGHAAEFQVELSGVASMQLDSPIF